MRTVGRVFALLSLLSASGATAPAEVPLREEIVGSIDRMVRQSSPFDEAVLSRFLNYPPNALAANSSLSPDASESPFKPNPRFWLKDVDFSCASPWNSGAGRFRAGTAISRRHIVFAKHFALSRNVRIVFVAKDGTPSAYYLERVSVLPDCDIAIGLLNAELTPDIVPAKVLSPDFEKHIRKLEGLPVVTLNQYEKAVLSEMRPTYTNSPTYQLDDFAKPESKDRLPFNAAIHAGDSGSPTFLIVNGEPVLLFCQTTTIGGYGLHRFYREIKRAMDELCPGYELSYPNYSKREGR